MITNKAIQTTAKMLDMQQTASRLFGARYAEVIEPWKRVLQHVAKERGVGTLEAGLFIAGDYEKSSGRALEGVDILAMTAAMVDLAGEGRA